MPNKYVPYSFLSPSITYHLSSSIKNKKLKKNPATNIPHLQARIAEEAGAVAVMALERVPADIRAQGGVARMSDPKMIREIMETVTIPVMAKARIGHFVECQVSSSPSIPIPSFLSFFLPSSHPSQIPF